MLPAEQIKKPTAETTEEARSDSRSILYGLPQRPPRTIAANS